MNKVSALNILEGSDHGFISKEGVDQIAKAFNVNIPTYLAKANPEDFKGLTLWDKEGNSINEMEGQDAHKVAISICQGLKIEYRSMFGIGSQLRACTEAISKKIN